MNYKEFKEVVMWFQVKCISLNLNEEEMKQEWNLFERWNCDERFFSVDDKVKTLKGKCDENYHEKRKGSVGIVQKIGINSGIYCCWVRFSDKHEEWYYEYELNRVLS